MIAFLSSNEFLIVVLVVGFFIGLIWSTFYGLYRAAKTKKWGWFWGILIGWAFGLGWIVGLVFLLGPARRTRELSRVSPRASSQFCASCNTEVLDDSRYCSSCGVEV